MVFVIPFRPESIMSSPSSLRHTMCGVGCPVALQESVKFSPSRTTNCELSFLVIILGGTVREEKSYEVIFIKSIWPSIFTNNFKVSRTMSHGISIDLTHVPAPVIRLHSLQLQSPNIGLWPFEWNPRIARNHIIVYGENSLRIHSNPSYLQRTN